ncbi:hypothetical protein [Halosimplex pelagicum]|uniref:TrbC/VirB2 family protein n=1 Tax=Halosimplex pelagicum TaxID=869886 RepID=A0A7D5PEZ6_9EURY|nr:hypothetical protein [Halosimplex pelagicum]QLH82179.1 hypothetical protein HZS54_11430 [Halosimplex pelagicum]
MRRSNSYLTAIFAVTLLILLGSVVLVGPASADCTDPSNGCSETNEITDILANIVDVVVLSLRYAGFITLAFGSVLWFTASANSNRAQTGVWLTVSGVLTIIFYIGYEAFLGLLKFISGG